MPKVIIATPDGKLPQSKLPVQFPFNVLEFGAVGDGVADDTAAIQATLNAAKDAIRTSGAFAGSQVLIPSGIYKVSSTITQVPYVKVITQGAAILEWTGGNNTCWHITALSDDPDPLYAGLEKQEINEGPLIDGNLIIRSKATSNGTSVGLEVGSRTDVGTNRSTKIYTIRGVSVTRFDTLLKLNTYNHYIGRFENCHFELAGVTDLNGVNLQIGTVGLPNTNSGENMEFSHCVFAGGDGIRVDAAGWDLNFNQCSFDYMNYVAKIAYGYGRMGFFGGHIEAIYNEIIQCTASDGDAAVFMSGTTLLTSVSNMFSGNALTVDGTFYQRVAGEDFLFSEGLFMHTTGDLSNLINLNKAGYTRPVSAFHNILPDPSFSEEVTGGVASSPMVHWTFDAGGVGLEVVADPAFAGGKALQITMTSGGYITFTSRHAIPVRNLDEAYATAVFKTDSNGFNAGFGAIYTNPDGTDQPALALVNPFRPRSFVLNTYETFQSLTFVQPAKINRSVGVKPQWLFSNPSGSTITLTVGYIYFGR